MNGKWRRFAPLGLYLALIAALAAVTLYIIQRQWNLYLQISLALVVLGLAVFAILDPQKVRELLTGRQARYGSNTFVMSLAFIGILVVANYLAYTNSKRWDLTEDKQNTLAEETLATLESLPQNVTAQAFYTARLSSDYAQGLLEQYKFASKGKFDYSFIDPDADPIAAQQAKITRDGMIVMHMGDRQEPVELVSEKEMTAALVRLMSDKVRAVYFLTGHGERNPEGTGNEAYSSAKAVLESKNYKVGLLNLLTSNSIPEDAEVIVIAGPQKPVSEQEVAMLDQFLVNGGSLIVMEEPLPVTQFGDQADPLANYLIDKWGITLGADIVVDLTSQQPFVAFANEYGDHVITTKLQGLVTFFPTVRSVQVTSIISQITSLELVLTSQQAWAETDLASLNNQDQQIQADEGVDLIGNVPMAAVAESEDGKQRLAVFGDVDFAADASFTNFGNGDLLINTIDWAAEQENLINLTPKDSIQRVLVPAQTYTMGLILFSSVFLLPGIVLISGVVVWAQRRKRG